MNMQSLQIHRGRGDVSSMKGPGSRSRKSLSQSFSYSVRTSGSGEWGGDSERLRACFGFSGRSGMRARASFLEPSSRLGFSGTPQCREHELKRGEPGAEHGPVQLSRPLGS